MLHVIIGEGSMDKFFCNSNISKLKQQGLEVLAAPEYKAKKTIIVKNIDQEVAEEVVQLWLQLVVRMEVLCRKLFTFCFLIFFLNIACQINSKEIIAYSINMLPTMGLTSDSQVE